MAADDLSKEVKKETKMEMTPMIDVTFLLLIFFLCTIKFKVLEGKIPTYLPKDAGVNPHQIDAPLEKIEIDVRRLRSLQDCREEARRTRGDPRAWIWHEDQIQVRVNGRAVTGLAHLHTLIAQVVKPYVDERLPKEDWPKATLRPGPQALYIDVVKVVNECLRADFDQITFVGARTEQ